MSINIQQYQKYLELICTLYQLAHNSNNSYIKCILKAYVMMNCKLCFPSTLSNKKIIKKVHVKCIGRFYINKWPNKIIYFQENFNTKKLFENRLILLNFAFVRDVVHQTIIRLQILPFLPWAKFKASPRRKLTRFARSFDMVCMSQLLTLFQND